MFRRKAQNLVSHTPKSRMIFIRTISYDKKEQIDRTN